MRNKIMVIPAFLVFILFSVFSAFALQSIHGKVKDITVYGSEVHFITENKPTGVSCFIATNLTGVLINGVTHTSNEFALNRILSTLLAAQSNDKELTVAFEIDGANRGIVTTFNCYVAIIIP